MDRGEGSATGSLLLDTGVTGGLGEDSALGDEDDVTVRELLLELTGESMQITIINQISKLQ